MKRQHRREYRNRAADSEAYESKSIVVGKAESIKMGKSHDCNHHGAMNQYLNSSHLFE